jgi:hypothetical protein
VNDELDHIFGDDPDLVDEDAPIIDSDLDPGGSIPGGTAELVALAAHDANHLLRFVESAMTESEATAFLEEVRARDPESADRLLQMREDQRLLRTSLELETPTPDLLGPVRAQIARGELVQVQSEIGTEAADPTAFMTRSVASLAQRRRRARRRPLTLAAMFGAIGVVLGVFVAPRLRDAGLEPSLSFPISEEAMSGMSLAPFGLVLPVRDRVRMELAMSIVAVNHGAVLVRNPSVTVENWDTEVTPPLVGAPGDAPEDDLRRELGRRGFLHAMVVPRREVPLVLAEVGALVEPGPRGSSAAILVPSSSEDPGTALGQDAFASWSRQSEASRGLPMGVGRLVVPIALIEVPAAN